MSESSTNSNCSRRYCKCGSEIKRRTSWTDLNPQRRFEACCNNRNNKRRLHFFAWVEKEILPGLLRRLRGIEDELRATAENFILMEEEKNKLEQKLREEEEEIKILKETESGNGSTSCCTRRGNFELSTKTKVVLGCCSVLFYDCDIVHQYG
ncbi:uncharacterized protein At4g04775-like [Prunus persica]|uniref:uncharacterized protein At4g04775-like n=1 Tax=Prunus persica TaxID=3760 RepID=UPI0009AB936B|nr:uncharacterized protein At4g04775-like [Prunus persica]